MNTQIKIHPKFTDYALDQFGNVVNIKFNRIVKGHKLKNNYWKLDLMKDKVREKISYHKFIYECYNGLISLDTNTVNGLTLDHIDGNKSNNSIDNLQVMSLGMNIRKYHEGKLGKLGKYMEF